MEQQQEEQQPSPAILQEAINVLTNQRNSLMDQLMNLQIENNINKNTISSLSKELEEVKNQLAAKD